jgi:hypothetical protein
MFERTQKISALNLSAALLNSRAAEEQLCRRKQFFFCAGGQWEQASMATTSTLNIGFPDAQPNGEHAQPNGEQRLA